jgi:hypothetical protein
MNVQVYRPTQCMLTVRSAHGWENYRINPRSVNKSTLLWNYGYLRVRLTVSLPTAHLLYNYIWSTES